MLTEFAMTPDVLEYGSLECLRELAMGMFPRNVASPVLLSDLYGGNWCEEAVKAVGRIANQSSRVQAQELLKMLKKILVKRPHKGNWPDDERDWVREAIATSEQEPIARIVATAPVFEELRKSCASLRSIDSVARPDFWDGVATSRSMTPRIDEQVSALRSICVHARFLAFASPYVRGGSDDETDFVQAMLRSALCRPEGYPPPTIDIHTQGPENAESLATNIIDSLQKASSRSARIRLFVWRKLLERVLLAGDYVPFDGQPFLEGCRWGMSFSHIGRKNDAPEAYRATWALLNKQDIEFWRRKFYSPAGPDLLDQREVWPQPRS